MSTETSRRIFLGVVGAAAAAGAGGADMEKVTGIGGLFFRAKDPKGLAKWYSDHLGVALVPSSYDASPWRPRSQNRDAGPDGNPQQSAATDAHPVGDRISQLTHSPALNSLLRG